MSREGARSIAVRPGRADDLAAVAAIQGDAPDAAQWRPTDYLDLEFRVAESDGEVAGFLVARRLAARESEVLNLAVRAEWRRRGVGRMLLESWIRDAAGDVFLEVRESNQAARKFYEQLGFEPVGTRPEYYQNPVEAAVVLKFHSC